MTNRQYTEISMHDEEVRRLVDEIAKKGIDVAHYRDTMIKLGEKLAEKILSRMPDHVANDVCVVCTVEDADFLARGVLDVLDRAGMGSRTKLLCLWNEKIREGTVSLSPVLRQYKEESTAAKIDYIIVKSIISGACVVKTNLTRALSTKNYDRVFVASPVLLDGAQDRLEREFPAEVSKIFDYVWFATDFEKSGEDVLPGIGGSVYERLGLGNEHMKNKHVPDIVKKRRVSHFQAPAYA